MKIKSIQTRFAALAGVLAMVGCQQDAPQIPTGFTGTPIAVTAQTGGDETDPTNSTRTTLNGFDTEWVQGDKIGVFSTQAGATNLALSAASTGASSAFGGGALLWGTGAHNFFAYYPHVAGVTDHTKVPISLPATQTQSVGGNSDHLAALDFLYAEPLTSITPGNAVQFRFKHAFTLLEFRVLGEGKISKLVLDIPSYPAAMSGTLNLATGALSGSTTSATVTLNLTQPATLTQDKTTTPALYMMISSSTSSSIPELTVTATINGEPKTITKSGFVIAPGRKYTLVVNPEPDILTEANFPDPAFLAYCRTQTAWDKNKDGKLSPAEAALVKSVSVSGTQQTRGEISSLEGIEYFTGLETLHCQYNKITALDVSKNTALTWLLCNDNQISYLDISGCNALTTLNCGINELSSLDIPQNTLLTTLTCRSNKLSALDISGCVALTSLDCVGNKLTSLNTAHNVELTSLQCYVNELSTLDVSNNINLTHLYCDDNRLTNLHVSGNTALTLLHCDNNRLTSLDVSQNSALTALQCRDNPLTSLILSKALISLDCIGCELTSLDLSECTALAYLDCMSNKLPKLDISKNKALNFFRCNGNPGNATMNPSEYSALFPVSAWFDNNSIPSGNTPSGSSSYMFQTTPWNYVYSTMVKVDYYIEGAGEDVYTKIADPAFLDFCKSQTAWDANGDGRLTTAEAANIYNIDITGTSSAYGEITSLEGIEYFTELQALDCSYNKITSLDLSKNTRLVVLYCEHNPLTMLNVSGCTALKRLQGGDNQLSSLDVSNNTDLTFLSCRDNQITTLDMSKNAALTTLYCENNKLSSLNISANTALENLNCTVNTLTSLNVSKNTKLSSLSCGSCSLTSLDISNNTALTSLYCAYNQLSSLDIANNTKLKYLTCDNNPGDGVSKMPVKAWFDNDNIPADLRVCLKIYLCNRLTISDIIAI